MQLKTLHIGKDLRESISYNGQSIPLSVCIDNFDDYFQREWGCHWHDEIEFGVIQRGIAEFTIYNGQERFPIELHKGDGIFINSGCLHSAKALAPDTVIAGFVLPVLFFNKLFENAAYQIVNPIIDSDIESYVLKSTIPKDQQLLSSVQEICSITDQEVSYELHFVETACKIWRLLTIRILQDGKTSQAATKKIQEQRIKQLLSFIHEHYSEHISIEDMAKSALISRTECFRCFQTVLGQSPVEYLTEYRLSMAMMFLANTKRSLSDISYSCGFNNPSYFGKLFRERCGLSPKKYRDQIHIQK
ncbi:MAG: helix-turn-helix domain-containing protein [Butyrivibrio sp.]|nr:helix-turn-helix domain-containing protein [Acetatifactor muris]MCM1560909.1 helix-turn-helix domain-containing protein [Butyrivibrio sp.]